MPRPGTPVIPPGWEAHHRPTAEGQLTAEGTITRQADAATFDETAGRSVYPDPTTVYAGPIRVQASQRLGEQSTIGNRSETAKRYQVTVPLSADPVRVNDLVEITKATDPQVAGLKLVVIELAPGTLLWQRNMTCLEWQPTSR